MTIAIHRSLFRNRYPSLARELFGLRFPTPIGSAPGMDPFGDRYNCLSWRFSFVEIGPLTPSDATPRRTSQILQRVIGTPNESLGGIRHAIRHIQEEKPDTLISANITADKVHLTTESVAKDLMTSFTRLYDFADMFVIDTFRKNADNVLMLQDPDSLREIIDPLLDMRICYETIKPLFLRVSDSIARPILEDMLDYMMLSGIDGIIAGYESTSPEFVRTINEITKGRFPVIACGNIPSGEYAKQLFEAGACLIQVSKKTGMILRHLQEK